MNRFHANIDQGIIVTFLTPLVILCFQVLCFSQLKVDVKLEVDPLIEKGDIYIATDFNEWNAGDPDFRMTKVGLSHYSIVLENVPERFEYKFTQGTWATAEGTPAGLALPNRVYTQNESNKTSINNTILGWEEQIVYSFIVNAIPENTPKDASIYVAGNFNNWDPEDENYRLKKSIDGSYRCKVYSDSEEIEFKFTRGSWDSVEGRESGKARPNRTLKREFTNDVDNLTFRIVGWEDLQGAFSFYSIYDLLLLFSIFQGVLLLIAIPNLQSSNTGNNKWLLCTIGLSTFSIFFYLLSNYQNSVQYFSQVLFFSDFVIFLYGPIFYFYLRKLLFNIESLPSKWYLHFIPFLIQLIIYLPFLLQPDKTLLDRIMNQESSLVILFLAIGFAGFLWNTYYWNLFRKTIKNYQEQFQSNFSYDQNLNYLTTILIIQFVCLTIWFAFFVVFGLSRFFNYETVDLQENFIDLIWLSFSMITYILGYFAIHQPETFKATPENISIFDDILESTPHKKTVNKLPKKDQTQTEAILPVIEAFEKNIEENKPFLNPKLTLSELAAQINIQPHVLSKTINEHYGKNFFELINGYRINEFKNLVKQEKFSHYTLLALAYEVGFNSKTAFNRSFKKITKQTPKEYFEEVKESSN
ncbi:helix-turn-helix domain-containing protein [uncultured Arcticibacterium sp.]|uniref:helix-turn-helix domain-containing protein n=1 Tax=uncultured Arcticibacterium sp. TaxID=2173042 RepID=UPI0030F5AD7E